MFDRTMRADINDAGRHGQHLRPHWNKHEVWQHLHGDNKQVRNEVALVKCGGGHLASFSETKKGWGLFWGWMGCELAHRLGVPGERKENGDRTNAALLRTNRCSSRVVCDVKASHWLKSRSVFKFAKLEEDTEARAHCP